MPRRESTVNKGRVFAFAVLVLLFFILIFLLWWWFGRQTEETATVSNANNIAQNSQPTQRYVVNTPPVNQPDRPVISAGEFEIQNLARNFTERYGSWSTDSNYQNLIDLYPNITTTLRREFEQTIRNAPQHQEFYGIDTKALTIDILSRSEQRATVQVMTQRITTSADQMTEVLYEELLLTMVRQGEYWYVDSAAWK